MGERGDCEEVMSGRDPWVHRSQRMSCFSCMWYVPKPAFQNSGPTSLGRCRRHAPTMSGYPVVFDTDWCGDHKLDEEAIAEKGVQPCR